MPELSSLIRQRLQAGETPRLQHPDADTLTAYVEQLLPANERRLVLEHISLCGDCREIVFLATPEDAVVAGPEAVVPDAIAGPVRVSARRRWFLTPSFGLAASIAAMAAAITLVVELPNKNHPASVQNAQVQNNQVQNNQIQATANPAPQAPVAQTPATAAPAADARTNGEAAQSGTNSSAVASLASSAAKDKETTLRAAAAPPAFVASRGKTSARDSRLADQTQMAAKSAPAPAPAATIATSTPAAGGNVQVAAAAAPVLEAKAVRQDFLNAQRFPKDLADSSGAPANQANVPSAPAPQNLSVNGLARPTLLSNGLQQTNNAYLVIPESQQQASQGVMTFTPRQPEHPSLLSKIVEVGKRPIKRAEPLLTAQNAGRFAMTFNSPSAVKQSEAVAPSSTAETTDSSSSNLAKSPAFTAGSVGGNRKAFAGATASYRWKVQQGKLLRSADSAVWIEGYSPSDGIEFSAVSATGSDIWAGGDHGQLVHSRDAGITWEKVSLSDSAVGNIVSIANNGMHISVTTSPSQGWSSLDGGKTWLKLPQ